MNDTAPGAAGAASVPAACLGKLGADAQASWRLLRVAAEFPDFAHAARRLHLSHAALRERLLTLSGQLGAEHVRLADTRIELSAALRQALRAPPLLPF